MKYLLVDSNALIHRAYHAYPADLTLKDGTPINAVYGFASLLITAIEKTKPDFVICTFDNPKPTFRHTEFVDYKAHRKSLDQNLIVQFPLCREIPDALDIPSVSIEGFEADDMIGTLARKLETKDSESQIIILTGDSDEYQLVSQRTSIFMAARFFKDSKLMNIDDVRAKLGFEPELIPHWKALKGDTSDNIPGVSGIGDKVATDLVKQFGTISNIYNNLDKIKISIVNKLVADQEMAEKSLRLATIDRAVPLSLDILDNSIQTALFADFDFDKAKDVFTRFEFRSLVSKLEKIKGTNIARDPKSVSNIKNSVNIVNTDHLDKREIFAFAIEIDGWLVGWDIKSYLKEIHSKDSSGADVSLFESNVNQNLNLTYKNCPKFDLKIAEFILSEGESTRTLIELFSVYLNVEVTSEDINLRKFDSALLIILKQKLEEELKSKDLYHLFEDIEMKILDILLDMELTGIRLDTETLRTANAEIEDRLRVIKKNIFDFIGHEFNVGSPKQVGEVLALELNIPLKKKSRSGQYGTDEYILHKYQEAFPVIDEILKYRELTKLQSTYIEGLSKLVVNNRIHTTYNQAVTSTGRLSSSNPNLQNIPRGEDIAKMIKGSFIASDGYKLVSIDYSQQELRILAHLSQERNLIDTYKNGLDIHKVTASKIFGVRYEEVTKDQRNKAKTINFGIVYGMGSQALSQSLKITLSEAISFITKFFASFPKIKEYYDTLFTSGKELGYIQTIGGRRRSTKNLNSGNQLIASNAKRELMNFPIQGSAADQTKLGMIKCQELIISKNWDSDVKLLLQVHDELVFEVRNDDKINERCKLLADMMQEAMKLDSPVEVEIKIGDRWGQLEEI